MWTQHKYWGSMQCMWWYECIMRLHVNAGRRIIACSSHDLEVQRALNWDVGWNPISWLGLLVRHTLTVTSTLRSGIVLTWAFIRISSSCTLGIGCWQKSDIICLGCVMNTSGSRYVVGGRAPIESLSRVCNSNSISLSSLDGNLYT